VTGPSSVAPPAFSVLAVCTGNICRSPALELRLRAALAPDPDVVVSSAGVRALSGEPVDPAMVALLGEVPHDLRARQLTPELVRSAGLVLALTREHRRAVVTAVPAAVRRTFTLREFADLAMAAAGAIEGALAPARALEELVRVAPRYRGDRATDGDDIEDPYGKGPEVFARVLAAIDGSVDAITLYVKAAGDVR
jgi:protein-tyrosine phosphatase